MQQWYQCPRCSAQVAYGTRFCGNCGTTLNWQQQTPPVYQAPLNYQQQGKPIGMEVSVKTAVPYPNEEDRWRLYTHPLTSVFYPYFEKVFVQYYETKGQLHHFIIRTYDPKFVTNQQNEDEFYNSLFTKLCNEVINLFSAMNIWVQIYDVWRSYQSYEDYVNDSVTKKMGKDPHANMRGSNVEMMNEDMRIIRHADGRHCLAFTDKKSGRRCYTDIPEKLAKEIGEQYIYRVQ